MTDVFILEVRLHGAPIATLTRVAGDRVLLAFNEDYIANDDRQTLSLGFKDQFGGLIAEHRPTQTKLPPFFSNLLPEGPMRRYLAEKAAVNPEREFFLLWALGRDLPGAVTVAPLEGGPWPAEPATRASWGAPGDGQTERLRFSLAGIQLKFSALKDARSGLTLPARGVGGNWIVKLPSLEYDGVPENEFSMMRLASLVGISAPETDLVDVEKIVGLPESMPRDRGPAFAIKRFDRAADGAAIHVEDFAQIFRVYPDDKYKRASLRNLAAVLAIEAGEADQREFAKRAVFSALIGNGDMHLKNWSVIYRDGRSASLAPAYDFVSTIAYLPNDAAALNFSRTKRFSQVTVDELRHFAAKARLPEKLVLDAARETVSAFRDHWEAEKPNLPMSKKARAAIDAHVKTVPLVEECG